MKAYSCYIVFPLSVHNFVNFNALFFKYGYFHIGSRTRQKSELVRPAYTYLLAPKKLRRSTVFLKILQYMKTELNQK